MNWDSRACLRRTSLSSALALPILYHEDQADRREKRQRKHYFKLCLKEKRLQFGARKIEDLLSAAAAVNG